MHTKIFNFEDAYAISKNNSVCVSLIKDIDGTKILKIWLIADDNSYKAKKIWFDSSLGNLTYEDIFNKDTDSYKLLNDELLSINWIIDDSIKIP